MVVLERRLQPVTVLRCLPGALSRRRHDDVRVVVAVIAMGTVRVLDHFDEAVPVGRGIEGVTMKVLVIVAVRHAAVLGGRGGPYGRGRPRDTRPIKRLSPPPSSGRARAVRASRRPGS